MNGTQILGDNTTALNLLAGDNVSLSNNSGTVTIAATDTTYSSLAAASGGTAVSLVTTGEKYTWNSKTSNTGTVTSVATGAGLTGGTITGSGTIKADLKSETKSSLTAASKGSTTNREYAVGLDSAGDLSVNVPWTDTNTHRPIQVNGTQILGDNTTVLNLKAGDNVSISNNSGTVTIAGTVTDTHRPIQVNGTQILGDNTTALNLLAGDNVSLSNNSGTVTISSSDTTYSSLSAASGGTAVSLVTTGEKYTWNNKSSLALGTTSSTAYRGDYGNTAYTHATDSSRLTTAKTSGLYKFATTNQGHIASVTAVAKSDITALGLLDAHQTIKQDGVTGATANRFGTCTVAAGTAAKTVSITTGAPTLEAGLRVTVKFNNANTANTPTLNVNSLGAKNIFYHGTQITTGDEKAMLTGVCDFVYDGTQWHLMGGGSVLPFTADQITILQQLASDIIAANGVSF